jgi:ABC-2 type transport system permease protein
MLHGLSLYQRLILVQIRSQLQYRIPFLMDALGTGLTTLLGFATLAFVFQRFESLGGWRLAEVAFLFGMVEMSFGLMDMIFSGYDPQFFGRNVRLGLFDQLMLRPVGLVLQVLSSVFLLRRMGRILQGAAILFLSLAWLDVTWTPLKIAYLPVVIFSLVAFFGGLFIVGATITFWTIDSIEVMNVFTYGGSEMISYPMHIYQDWMRRFFTYILPAIFLNYYPALFFLDKPDPFNLPAFAPFLSPLAGLGILAGAFAFWNIGVRHYQSSGT